MAQQPNLFPPNPADQKQERQMPRGGSSPEISTRPIPWMTRVEVLVRVIVRLYLGMLVLALPWLPFWTQNNLFTYDPLLLTLASSGFVRGVFSGIGVLNIFLAVIEAKDAPEFR